MTIRCIKHLLINTGSKAEIVLTIHMFNRIFDLNLLGNHVCIERNLSPFVCPPPQTPSTLRSFAEYRETGKCMRDIRWQFSGEFWREKLIDFKI